MGWAEKRGKGEGEYWRGRYKIAPGKYGTVCGPDGKPAKFAIKKDAEREANARETRHAQEQREADAAAAAGRARLGPYASTWLAGQERDLDEDTVRTYRSIIRCHLIGPPLGGKWLDEITRDDIAGWEAAQREAGYELRGIRNRRRLLSLILADAAEDPAVTLTVNVAAPRRGRGRKAGPFPAGPQDGDDDEDSPDHGKVITDPLGALLIAERCALMSGRDDEFTAVILAYYTGLRWGELAGLETRYAEPGRIRVMWQLRRDTVRKRPKFGKTREADIPGWLYRLVDGHITRTGPGRCPCHGRTYVFSGIGRARGTRQAVTLAMVAAQARVSQATVSAAVNRPHTVAEQTRARIAEALEVTGYRAQGTGRAPHWYRSGFGQWVWGPAVNGAYPERGQVTGRTVPARPVPVRAEPWPGVPVRGRGNTARADGCWEPLAAGMTPHGLRHAHKSLMAELRVHEVLSHDRLGHEMAGIAGIYSHPTPQMRRELMEGLTVCWEKSLDDRLALCPSSPVPVLDSLLRERASR